MSPRGSQPTREHTRAATDRRPHARRSGADRSSALARPPTPAHVHVHDPRTDTRPASSTCPDVSAAPGRGIGCPSATVEVDRVTSEGILYALRRPLAAMAPLGIPEARLERMPDLLPRADAT